MTENRYLNLLAKKLSGDATPGELQELESLVKAHPEWNYSTEIIENIWNVKTKETGSYDAEIAFELHAERLKKNGIILEEIETPSPLPLIETSHSGSRKKIFYGLAFSALSFLLIFLLVRNHSSSQPASLLPEKTFSEVSTRYGSKTKLVLPDSSVVWLNAGSRLTYNEHFGVSNRNTTLTGEAYFDVKKSTIPFTISANGLHIKVLGTAFNVKSYPNEKTTETSLIRGRVEVTHDKRPGEVFILKPNEKLVIANEPAEEETGTGEEKAEPKVLLAALTHTIDKGIIETSWVNNKLVFQDESFEEVAKKMERWYDVRIDIKDEKIAQLHLNGTFENETVKQALTALQIAFDFDFTIHGNYITITR
jgi:ferric-dicitrate binding protein FerR (iron transport regulator)